MEKYFKRNFALSDKGAKDLIKAILSCTLTNISFMLPVGLLYFVVEEIWGKFFLGKEKLHSVLIYIVISVILL